MTALVSHHWIGAVLLKIVISEDTTWYQNYPDGVFFNLKFGGRVKPHDRYVFAVTPEELGSSGHDINTVTKYWESLIIEANS